MKKAKQYLNNLRQNLNSVFSFFWEKKRDDGKDLEGGKPF